MLPWIFPLQYTAAPWQLGIFVHFLAHTAPPASSCPCVFRRSQVSCSHLPGMNPPETRPGKHPVCRPAASQSGEISQGLATGIKLSSPSRGINGGELHLNSQPDASWLIFISAHNLWSWHCQLQLNVAPLMIPTCGRLEWKRSAVSICTVCWQLFIVICALYQYSRLWTPGDNSPVLHKLCRTRWQNQIIANIWPIPTNIVEQCWWWL